MISDNYIKELEFETIEDVYTYIYESYINGQFNQCKKLIDRLSLRQSLDFIKKLLNNEYDNDKFTHFILENKNY